MLLLNRSLFLLSSIFLFSCKNEIKIDYRDQDQVRYTVNEYLSSSYSALRENRLEDAKEEYLKAKEVFETALLATPTDKRFFMHPNNFEEFSQQWLNSMNLKNLESELEFYSKINSQ